MDGMGDYLDAASNLDAANVIEKDQIEYLTLEDLGKVLDELAKSRSKSCKCSKFKILHYLVFLYS